MTSCLNKWQLKVLSCLVEDKYVGHGISDEYQITNQRGCLGRMGSGFWEILYLYGIVSAQVGKGPRALLLVLSRENILILVG